MFFGLFWLLSYSFICFFMSSSKMTSFPLHFLLLFILFPPVLSLFCLFLFSRFVHLSLPFKLHFVGIFIISVFLHVKLCAKKCIFLDCSKTLFLLSSLFHQNLSFLCFLFLLGLSQTNIFSMFCFSVSWEMVSHFVWLSFFSILLVNSVSFFFAVLFFFDVSKNKKKLFFDGNDGKTVFCILFLFSFFLKRQCVREKIRCIFHYFWNCLNPFLSSLQSTEKQTKKKTSFFVFVQSLCCFTFFKHFPIFFTFNRMFPYFSIAVLCIFFWINSFFFSLFCSWSQSSFLHFFFVSVSFLSCQTKYKIFSFFFEEDFFEQSLFLCLISCFPHCVALIPCLFHVFGIFERFLKLLFLIFFLSIFVSGLFKKLSLFLDTTFKKISLILVRKITLGKKTFVFVILTLFLLLICFVHAWSSIFPFFGLFRANILFLFVLISLFLFKKKKNTSKNKLILFIFVFTLLVLTLPELLSLSLSLSLSLVVLFSLFSPCLLSFFVSSCFLFSCSITLLMFICSLWCFFCLCAQLPFLLTLFIPFFKTFSSNSFVSSFSSGFSILFFRTRSFFFFEKVS